MLIDKSEILEYIPQRNPFVMIDAILNADENCIEGEFTINENVLANNSYCSQAILIEFIAQTCAAGFGYLSKDKKEKGKLGFIGAVSKLEINENVTLGDYVRSQVKVLTSFDQVQLIQGIVKKNGVEILSCQMKIVTP